MLLDDLAEEDDTLPIDQECRRIRRFVRCVPPEPVQIREVVAGIQQQFEVIREFFNQPKTRSPSRRDPAADQGKPSPPARLRRQSLATSG